MGQPITSKQYFRTLTIIFYALIVGQIMMIAVAFISPYLYEKIITDTKEQMYITLGVSFISVFGFSVSRAIFKNKLKRLSQQGDLAEKMHKYMSLNIAKYAIFEGCSFCAAIAALLTGETILLTFSILMLMLVFVDRPSNYKAIKDLQLSAEEAQKIQNSGEIICFTQE